VKPNATSFEIFYVWADHLGTPRQITDAANQSRWEWANNDPFGNNAPNENPSNVGSFSYNLRFPGQYYDQETGKHYNYFRDYDSTIGRYVESDPAGLRAGSNTFSYVNGNPLGEFDRKGLVATFKNCRAKQRSAIERAERQLRDFLSKECPCAKAGGACVDCAFAHFLITKLAATDVECADADNIVGFDNGIPLRAGGTAYVGSNEIKLYPALFDRPSDYRCFAATLFHETMHTMGIGHTNGLDSRPSDAGDPVYGAEFSCVRAGLCGGGTR